jgi:phage protein D
LATINTVDFLYTCPGHLSDPGFATLVSTSDVPKVAISAEEIAKVKAEWEEKEKKRKEKEKEKEKEKKEKEEKEKEKDSDNKTGDKEKEGSKSPKIPAAPSTPPPPAHERYTLHRNFFSSEYKEHCAVHKWG